MKSNTLRIAAGAFLGTLFAACFLCYFVQIAYGQVTQPVNTQLTQRYVPKTFLSATTTNATSTDAVGGSLNITGVKKLTFFLTHGGTATTSTGGAKFSIQVTPNGTTWYDFNKLIGNDIASTATSTVTVAGATSTVIVSANLDYDAYYAIRCIVAEIGAAFTQGEHTCAVYAEY